MIRRATPNDAQAVGDVFVRARDEMTYLPRIDDEHRPLLGGWFVDRDEIWVADQDGTVVGFAGVNGDVLTHLYVDPTAQNRGLGTALLERAKQLRPGRLELWVFQKNDGARRFYERHGFRLVELTDGGSNMEKEPDARYEWLPELTLGER
jgi:GNAT superfamily N-acetyltransferase